MDLRRDAAIGSEKTRLPALFIVLCDDPSRGSTEGLSIFWNRRGTSLFFLFESLKDGLDNKVEEVEDDGIGTELIFRGEIGCEGLKNGCASIL